MLTEQQKKLLEGKIEKIIREFIEENDFLEQLKAKHRKGKDDEEKSKEAKKAEREAGKENELERSSSKRNDVMKWLDSAQELHSVLSYDLWPDLDKDSARSEFSKKYNGEDANGKRYDFTDGEINTLYNMRDDFINRAGLDKHNFNKA